MSRSIPLLKPRLKYPGEIPYGGQYALNLPEKGFVGVGSNFDALVRSVKEYRRANGLPIGLGLESELEDEVCQRYSAECVETDARVPDLRRSWGFLQVAQGTAAMVLHRMAGSPLVDEIEAQRRAAICSACPLNVPFRLACGGLCGELKNVVDSIIGSKATQYESQLRSCGICQCYLSASIWVPLDIQQQVLTEEQKTQFRWASDEFKCWKAEGL